MANFEKMYKESWYTITDCGGDLDDWKDGYNKLLNGRGIGTPKEWADFTGAEINERYKLQGDNKYPDDLHFLAFSLDGLDILKLTIFKVKAQDRWFDDIVNNNIIHNKGDE